MTFRSTLTAVALLAALSLWAIAHAQTTPTSGTAAAAAADPMADMTAGEVRKIDKENRKITLRHGEIKALQMPGMTMVFQVRDPAILDRFKQGDKVVFKAEQANGALVVTDMHPAR